MMKNLLRHCEGATATAAIQRYRNIMDCFFITFLTMTLLFVPFANAQDNQLNEIIANTALPENAERYAPTHCDFDLVFPTSATTTKRCVQTVKSGAEKCFNLRSYSRIFDNNSALDIKVTCVPSSMQKFDRYNEPVMRTILKAMGTKANVDNQTINVKNDTDYRQGVLQGAKRSADSERIYEAQLWIGQNSVLTVEGTMSGTQNDQADQTFESIMSSIKRR